MIERDGKRFNCCESTIMKVNEKIPLDGFGRGVMRAISNMGGCVAGWGNVCGAVSGGAMVYGLLIGTEGDESPEDFVKTREKMRARAQVFIDAFKREWGHVNCFDLIGVDTRTDEGRRKYEENKVKGLCLCDDFVNWSANKLIELITSGANYSRHL